MARELLLRGERAELDLARVGALVRDLGELKGVAMKAGQILGYIDPSLDPQLRAWLSVLHTSSRATAWGDVQAEIQAALGDRAGELIAGMEREPFAVASIGQVHRATLPDGTRAAVKVRHPGVDIALENDFKGAGLGSAFASLFVPGASGSVRSMVEECRAAMLEECDYRLEAERQSWFAAVWASSRDVIVPRVIDRYSGATVLCTELRTGESLASFVAARPPQEQRDRAAQALFDFYVGTLYRHGVFHADPHPGNFAFASGPRLVMYDFGCVRSFDASTVRELVRLSRAVLGEDMGEMTAAFAALGGPELDRQADRDNLRELLRGFYAPMLERGRRRLVVRASLGSEELLRDKRALMRLRLPGKLLFLLRLRFGLYAVLSELGAELDWAALEERAAASRRNAQGESRVTR